MLNSNEHCAARLKLLQEIWAKQGVLKEFHIHNFTTAMPDLELSLLGGRDIGWREDSVLVAKMHFWEKEQKLWASNFLMIVFIQCSRSYLLWP